LNWPLTVWRLTGLALIENNEVKFRKFLSNQILKGQTAAKSALKRLILFMASSQVRKFGF
jgi:hypothetical protein